MERIFSDILRSSGKAGALIEIGRPWNGVMTGIFALLAVSILGAFAVDVNALLLFLTFTLAYMAGAALNDIFDESVDALNMPYRPLQEKRIRKKDIWIFSIALHIIALSLALLIDLRVFVITILFFIFGDFYSMPPLRFCKRGLTSHISLSFTALFIPMYAGTAYAVQSFVPGFDIMFFILSMFFLFVFVFLLKDFKDVRGDTLENKITPVIIFGGEKVRTFSIIGSLLSFALVLSYLPNAGIFLAPVFIFLILLVYSQCRIMHNPEKYFGVARIILFLITINLFLISVYG